MNDAPRVLNLTPTKSNWIGMSWGKKDWTEQKKKHSENLITRTKRNEPTIQAIWSPFSYIAQQQSIGVSAEKCSIRLIHASRYKKRTHTQFTQFKLHFQQFGILFYFILILFADATKLSSSFFSVRFSSSSFFGHFALAFVPFPFCVMVSYSRSICSALFVCGTGLFFTYETEKSEITTIPWHC